MRWLQPRLRIRSLLILMAIIGLILGGVILVRRSTEYRRLAWIAENDEGLCLEYLEEVTEAASDEEFSREFLRGIPKPSVEVRMPTSWRP